MIQAAFPSLGFEGSAHLLLTIVSLGTARWALPPLADLMLDTRDAHDARRTDLVAQAAAMASVIAEGHG